MTLEELKKVFDDFKGEGYEEEEILEILYLMYADGKMPLEDLRTMTETLGYEFTEEFEAMSEEDKKKKGLEYKNGNKAAEGVDKEDVEDAKEFKEGEDEDKDAPKAESETDDKDEDDDDDDKKAARLFGFNK